MQNRQERRRMEKAFGLMKAYQKGTPEQRAEIRARRREMGKKLHEQHLERVENAQRKAAEELEARVMQGLVQSGRTEEEARAIMNENLRLSQEREEKLAKRRERQKAAYAAKKNRI